MNEFIQGIIILVIPLSIVFAFLIKWLKDYKRTGKLLVLKNEKTKWWHFLFLILFLILSVYIILGAISVIGIENNPPIRIIPEEYNPWSWYT